MSTKIQPPPPPGARAALPPRGLRARWPAPRAVASLLAALLLLASAACTSTATVRLAHFSDYHARAVPRAAGAGETEGGLARAVAFLAPLAKEEGALVFSGGDMLSRGSPSWSDRHTCAEWPWLDGIVHAMAFGNHEADYGPETFARCRASVRFPILSANLFDGEGRPLLPPYAVFERSGVRVGVFAVAGPDFHRTVRGDTVPFPGATFGDRIEAARRVVRTLREDERVAAVVLIGHEHHPDDVELATKVPGIDLVFGSHSHREAPMERIPGTTTWTISGGAYLGAVCVVDLAFRGGRLAGARGELVRMTGRPEDAAVRERVAAMQSELEADPAYAPLFVPVANLADALDTAGGLAGDSPLGRFVTGVMRRATDAHVALTTASSLRDPLPRGPIVEEQLRAALPYPNGIVVYRVSGETLFDLLAGSVSLAGSDLTSLVSGARLSVEGGRLVGVSVRGRTDGPSSPEAPLVPGATYDVALTDYQASHVEPYRSILDGRVRRETGLTVRDLVRAALAEAGPP
jgi:5'-nucleotidase